MKLAIDLKVPTPTEWIQVVLDNYDDFLISHADGERKASNFALGLVAKYPMKTLIIQDLIDIAVEELEHFQQVYRMMDERNLQLPTKIKKDAYIMELLNRCHDGREQRFRDRLLIGSIVETRGQERFRIVAENHPDESIRKYYKFLWTEEAKHTNKFVEMALHYFPKGEVYDRLAWYMEEEGQIMVKMPITPNLH